MSILTPAAMFVRAEEKEPTILSENEAPPVTMDNMLEVGVILFVCVSTVASNVLMIASMLTAPGQREAMDYYILCLAVADLLCGLLIMPLSVYPAMMREWTYGDIVCRLSGYVEITLWSVSLYTYMWISVDRYLAIRKPVRYETIQTKTRCQCWILFTWVTSVFLCCPPLLGFSKGRYYSDGYICMLDFGNMVPYSITLALLVLAPSVLTILYTYFYIFSSLHKLRQCMTQEEREQAAALGEDMSNTDHVMAFILTLTFWLSWVPWFTLRLWEHAAKRTIHNHTLHFFLLWLGMLHCVWKLVVCVAMAPKFRVNVKVFFVSLCCRWKVRRQLIV